MENSENTVNSGCERESEKLLSKTTEDVSTKQKYAVTSESVGSPQHGENAATGQNVSGDHMSAADTRSTTSKTTDFHQLKITEQEAQQDNPKSSTWKRKILKVTVTIMFIIMAVGVIVIWTLHEGGGEILKEDGYFVFDTEEFILIVERVQYTTVFEGTLGGETLKKEEKDKCYDSGDKFCYKLDKGPTLHLKMLRQDQVQCYLIHWENISSEYVPTDCYDLKSAFWYGMMNTVEPSDKFWPISDVHISPRILHPGYNTYFGNVMDYYWLSTEGSALYVIDSSPILFSSNNQHNNKICISPPLLNHVGEQTSLKYAVCQGKSIKEVHKGTSKQFHKSSQSYGNKTLADVSQIMYAAATKYDSALPALEDLTNRIKVNKLNCSVMEVPKTWETVPGDHGSNDSSLDSWMKTSSSECKFVLPLSPVCSYNSKNFIQGIDNDEFLKNPVLNAVQMFEYENTQGAQRDERKIRLKGTLFGRLSEVAREYSAYAFQLSTLPNVEVDNSDLVGLAGTSDLYSNWLDLLYQVSPHSIWPLTSTSFRTQDTYSVMEVKFTKLNSTASLCLSNSIPNALTLGLYGYPFLMSSFEISDTYNDLDRELYIRWLQISLFFSWIKMPYSVLLNADIDIQGILSLRSSVLADLDKEKIMKTLSENTPLLRPVWWISPTDKETFKIADQFLLGDSYMVAPVLCNGTRSRNVYLPKGDFTWSYKDQEIDSGWHRGFQAPLSEVLLFKKNPLPTKEEL